MAASRFGLPAEVSQQLRITRHKQLAIAFITTCIMDVQKIYQQFRKLKPHIVRCIVGVIMAGFVYFVLHERFGGPFMFFEQLDPPAADPHRNVHIMHAWLFIYSLCGVASGLCNGFWSISWFAPIYAFISGIAFTGLRGGAWNSRFFLSEEGRYGTFAIVIVSIITAVLTVVVTRIFRAHNQRGETPK